MAENGRPAASPRPLRCSEWARQEHIDPIGSAGTYRGICCIEVGGPWPDRIDRHPGLVDMAGRIAAAGYRLQALHRREGAGVGRIVMYHGEGRTGFSGFTRHETVAARVDVGFVVDELIRRPGPHRPGRDVLVCTHGRRDVCCGAKGTALAAALDEDATPIAADVRVERTSHLGGHRFAPTALVLPEGTAWAHLDAESLRRIVRREGPIEAVLDRYRGCVGLASPALQVLERAVLAEVGWAVLDATRTGGHHDDGTVTLEVTFPDGSCHTWMGRGRVRRHLGLPDCGGNGEDGPPVTVEWTLDEFRRLT